MEFRLTNCFSCTLYRVQTHQLFQLYTVKSSDSPTVSAVHCTEFRLTIVSAVHCTEFRLTSCFSCMYTVKNSTCNFNQLHTANSSDYTLHSSSVHCKPVFTLLISLISYNILQFFDFICTLLTVLTL